MKPTAFFKRQKDEANSKFFSAVRISKMRQQHVKTRQYSWEAFGYKVYPSSLTSLTMCPKRFVEEDVHVPPNFSEDAIYRMAAGQYFHKLYQDAALVISSEVLWESPNVVDELKQKLRDNWPEVPMVDVESGISGRADLVLDIDDSPVPFELKTTSVDVDRWKEGYTDKLPPSNHELQCGLYCHLMNKNKYYAKPITKFGFGYVNLLMVPGSPGSEFEVYRDYTQELDDKIGSLISHIARHRTAYMNNKTLLDCEYPNCRLHKSVES